MQIQCYGDCLSFHHKYHPGMIMLLKGFFIERANLKPYTAIKACCFLLSIAFSYAQDTLDVPTVSVQRGYYEIPFYTTIISDVTGASIVYTLDGSDPTNSQNTMTMPSPASVYVDPNDETGRFTAPTVVLRAIASFAGSQPSPVVTHSYLFLNEIANLSPHEQKPGSAWPDRNMSDGSSQYMDYGLDPDVLNDPRYQDQIQEAFRALPAISLVSELNDLFAADSGIYFNALQHGREWERNVSVELLNPDDSPGFQIDAGLRIRGGWGRRNENPKHAFRLFFRTEYGFGKLEYPLFGDQGVDEFDKIDLRTSQNYSWAAEGSSRNTLVREIISRDIQHDMGQPYTRSRYYHLFLNGVYWGIYQTQERAEAAYAEAYFGGSRDDYDVIKVDIGENLDLYEIEATDGTLDAYQRLWELATIGFNSDSIYYGAQGQNPDGSINPEFENLIDVDNLIDYLICTYYVSDGDGPLNGNQKPNNFYAIYNRNDPKGFIYFRHDAEHSLIDHNGNLTGSVTGGEEFRHFNPRWLQQRLAVHPEYRLRFADRVFKHFYNNGTCMDAVSYNRVMERKIQIDLAIIAQSVRWGDSISSTPRTKDDDWVPAINFIVNDFFPGRTEIVRDQFRNRGWYPIFEPPVFSLENGVVSQGTGLNINTANGVIYYTLDDIDPRLPESVTGGGLLSPSAIEYTGELEINHTTHLKTRTLHNGTWSALNEITLIVPQGEDHLKITEIHYHPLDQEDVNDRELEFIELKNLGGATINLGGMAFVQGIDYVFPGGTQLTPETYIVLASNPEEFENRYGYYPFAEYSGQLSNSGETISLVNSDSDTLISVNYNDNFPWPNSADGLGYSIMLHDENAYEDVNEASSWRASTQIHGTPGNSDLTDVIEAEILPSAYYLSQNYPNPFNQSTRIVFFLASTENVNIEIFNARGQKVRSIMKNSSPQGYHQLEFDAQNLASGVYFVRAEMPDNGHVVTRKIVLMK